MGYRIIEYCGEKYKLTPKWYKQYLSALELMKKVKEKIQMSLTFRS